MKNKKITNVLTQDEKGGTDYTLRGDSCWITVNNLSLYLSKTEKGLLIDVYPIEHEYEEAMETLTVSFPGEK